MDLSEREEQSLLHEMVKGMKDLSIKVTKLESGQSSTSSRQGGGMKKLMKDAKRETTQVIQSVTTLGLCVKDSYGGSRFWQDVMEYARKGKVRVNELKRAGDEIWNFTGWDDPVDALSTYAQVNAQEVLVEEKRKRVEENDLAK